MSTTPSRRSFLTVLAGGFASGAMVAKIEAAPPATPELPEPGLRVLKRLRGVDVFVFERVRMPGGWNGDLGDTYRHELRCLGPYQGPAGDWQRMRCSVDIDARCADPALRVVGGAPFRYEENVFGLVHVARLCFAVPTALTVYRQDAADEVVVVSSSPGAIEWQTWVAPGPRWLDADACSS